MDIGAFIQSPAEFVQELAQVSDVKPDFGIHAAFLQAIQENPAIVQSVPMVKFAGDLQQYPPGTFCRLRCCISIPITQEYMTFKFEHEGRYYTPIVPGDFPPEIGGLDIQNAIERKVIGVSSVPALTEWLVADYSECQVDASTHLKVCSTEITPTPSIFTDPFACIVKVLFPVPDTPNVVFDFFGFFEEIAPHVPLLDDSDLGEAFYANQVSFIALSGVQVNSLYSPPIPPQMTPPPAAIREQVIALFSQFMGPVQAELLTLWLVGRVRKWFLTLPLGVISLNFTGCTPELASAIVQILSFLCTTLNVIELTCDGLNNMALRPNYHNQEFRSSTPLTASNGTRLVIDETRLEEGQFNPQGLENYSVLRNIVETQRYDFRFNDDQCFYEIMVSYPTLILSTGKSIIPTSVQVPIGEITSTECTISPEQAVLLRMYVEQIRNTDYAPPEESAAFFEERMREVMAANRSITPDHLHVLMHLNELECLSLGQTEPTPEIWEHVIQLFTAIMEMQQ